MRNPNDPTKLFNAKVYNLSLAMTAFLENVSGVSYTMRENQVWAAGFELPAGDAKNAFCLDNHYVELYDTAGTRIELFRIISSDSVRRSGKLYVSYECEHALATLLDQSLIVEMNAGPGTGATITALLAMQNVAHWQLGTCDFARNFLHYWTPGTTLLAALWQISGRLYDEDWQWTFDTTSYPWTLNLVEPGDDVVATIDYRLNMKDIKRTRNARPIINRLYPRGNGAGVDELTIMSINITGAATTVAVEALPDQKDVEVVSAVGFAGGSHVYLENAAGDWEINDVDSVAGPVLTMVNDLQHTYAIGSICHIGKEYVEDATSQTTNGIKEYPWKDERYTIPQNLYDAAIARLEVLKDPSYTYTAKGIDLWPLIGEHRFQLGELVRIRDNDLEILSDKRVTVLTKRDVTGKPETIEVQFDNKVHLFGENIGNIIYADDLDGVNSGGYYSKVYSTQIYAGKILLSAVPGGAIGSMPNPPSAAGSYLSAEYIGIHDGTRWATYMDNAARLIADDGTGDAYFRWDPTLLTTAKLQIKGTVLIEAGGTYDDIQDALADAAAALAAADGEIVGFFQDAIPGAGMSFGDIWIDTDEADPLTTGAIYRYEDPLGGSQGVLDWYAAPTNAIGLVYLDMATAQSTADGKITTYYQAAIPTAEAAGDLWVDTDDANKVYRATIAGADEIAVGEWERITGAVATLNVIGNAYITDLAASKITAGDITVGLNVNTGGYIKSANYVYHTAGWKIFPDGSAEFNNVYVRGSLNASDISGGTMSFNYISPASVAIISAMMANNSVDRPAIVNGAVNVPKLYIDGSVVFNGDGVYHNITGISDLRGPVWTSGVVRWGGITFPTSATTALTIDHNAIGDSVSLNNYDGTEYGIRLYAPNGQIRFLTKDAGATALAFEDWNLGEILVRIGGTPRHIHLSV